MTERSKHRAVVLEAWVRRLLGGACAYFIIDTHIQMTANVREIHGALTDHGVRLSVVETKIEARGAHFDRLANLLEQRIAQAEASARKAASAAERF